MMAVTVSPVCCLQGINMYHDVSHLLSRLINGPTPLRQGLFCLHQ